MRLIQFLDPNGGRCVGIVRGRETIERLTGSHTVYELAQTAIQRGCSLRDLIDTLPRTAQLSYEALIQSGRLLPPLDHPDPAHLLVTGTGLTHLGSADARDQMHREADTPMTDSMRMFRLGLEGGRPRPGEIGVQPEWFYKGDGSIVTAPYRPIVSPAFALDGGEEPEIAGLYVMEKQNYLYLAHSKLRPCSFGPELLLGELPEDVRGTVRIVRGGQTVWQKPFRSGERNMSHTIANLEYHHFKYAQFRRPGDAHVHFFGTATLSFAEGIVLKAGDEMVIEAEGFGRALRNPLRIGEPHLVVVKAL